MSNPLRFLQLSDVHFGARMTGGKLALTDAKARERAQDRRDAFVAAIALVAERDLDGVLVPGDLFDDESVTTDVLRFVMHHFESVSPKPVFIAPGNHDPFGGTSPYNVKGHGVARGLDWPSNVHIFAHEDFRVIGWPGREDVRVYGCGVAADVPSQQRRLAERIARVEGGRHLLLFHGSRDDGSWLEADKSTYPFSSDELVAQGFDWVALGHYHAHEIIRDATGRARGAYAGCLSSGGLDESGEKGAIVVSLSDGAAGVEFVGLDTRRTHRVECDLSASEFSDDARARIEAALARAGVGAKDMIHLTLIGRRSRGLDLGFLDQLVGRYFHLTINHSRLLPDVDLTQFPELSEATTVEERFVARLREAVEGGDAGARRALMYGLDALQQGRLDARYEE